RGLKVPKETFDVAEFANETVEKYRPQAKEKGLKIRAEISKDIGEVETVKLYLAEILQNFITNAIKYTEKGEVVLKVFEGEGYVEFAVIDTGIGISKKDLANVFEKFYRSEDFRTMQTSGTGLGLYIVRRLADIMKAKLVFGSELNKGSTFGVQIRRMRIK
ncbi:HAMP domain-containing histidine kinase, partial [Candidatus Saccharibacteria bacterium]|nr:HAMP domain-containing histidine kinase [Candidatus Saccharibacteria bacterium]